MHVIHVLHIMLLVQVSLNFSGSGLSEICYLWPHFPCVLIGIPGLVADSSSILPSAALLLRIRTHYCIASTTLCFLNMPRHSLVPPQRIMMSQSLMLESGMVSCSPPSVWTLASLGLLSFYGRGLCYHHSSTYYFYSSCIIFYAFF